MRPVIDGHNDVLSHLHEEQAPDVAILEEEAAAITVPRAREGGLAAGMFAVLPPTGEWEDVQRTGGGYEIPYNASVGWEESARTVGALGARALRVLISGPERDRTRFGTAHMLPAQPIPSVPGRKSIDLEEFLADHTPGAYIDGVRRRPVNLISLS